MQFQGKFETHFTIGTQSPQDVEALRTWCVQHGLKYTCIVLARGKTRLQPMLTHFGEGVLSRELARARERCIEIERAGFFVTRVKVEAALQNSDVPQTDLDARSQPERYFEHHITLLLDANAELTTLTQLAQLHSAHISRNARRVRNDGRQERFVTQRCYLVGSNSARRRLELLLDALDSGGFQRLDVEEEYVVHDSNADVDAGWIQLEG